MSKRFILLLSSAILILSSISFAQIITEQPNSYGVIEGGTATFSVHTIGGTSFQWYVNDILISGATDSSYTTPPAPLASNGSEFKVVVSDGVNPDDTSDAAILYVTATGSRVTGGQTVLYNFDEGDGTTINDVSGFETPLDLTINNSSNVSWTSAGLFAEDTALINSSSVATKVIDAVIASNEVTIELWIRPISTDLSKIFNLTNFLTEINFDVEELDAQYNVGIRTTATNDLGSPGTLDTTGIVLNITHVVVTFKDGVTKIYRNGSEVISKNIGGDFSNWDNGARLSLASGLSGHYPWKGIFYLAAIYGRALDSTEVLHNFSKGDVIDHAPIITEDPQNKKVPEGVTATFKVAAIGDSPLSFQWQKNGSNILGATDSFYTTPVTTVADSGNVYRVVVTNSSGSDTSQSVTLEVVAGGLAGSLDGLTHYYKFEESAPPYIDSFGFTDAISSNPPASVTGIVGNAQDFFQQTVDVPEDNLSDWEPNGSFTLEFWMKTTDIPLAASVAVGRNDNSSGLHWWAGFSPDGKALFQLKDKDNEGTLIGDKDPVVNDGNWHLITAVRDGNLGRNFLYVDGSKVDTAVQTYNASFEGTVDINIGYLNVSPYYYFTGSLDEVALYNVALSESEILEHYNNGQAGNGYNFINAPSNLVAVQSVGDTTNVDLTWNDNSSNESAFVIQRALGEMDTATAFTNIDTVAADVTVYTATTVSDTTTYTYRVYAFNADSVSDFSNKAEITTPIPVELTSFTANIVNGKILINWQTATEMNNSGFSLERSEDNISFKEIAFIRGHGTTTNKSDYSYTDNSILSGKYYYRLKQVDLDGSFHYTASIEANLGIPREFSLDQNYPNPFNPSTTIRFALPMNAKVNIKLYNTLGQEVVNILGSEQLDAGLHETVFNASNFSSGVYFYRLEAKGEDGSSFAETKRMLLIK